MSIDSTRIICTGCDYETRDPQRPIRIRYQATSGKSFETGRAKGWCYKCGGYADIENLNQGDLETKFGLLESERSEVSGRLGEINGGFLANLRHRAERQELLCRLDQLEEKLGEIGDLLEIVKTRRSKARCLQCWSDCTAPLSFDSADGVAHKFVHECGGSLKQVNDHSGPRFHFRLVTYTLNHEGILIYRT